MLTGEFSVSMDEKGRLLIPTRLRGELSGDTLILTKGIDQCLWLFSVPKWEVFSRSVQKSLGMFNPQHLMIQRRIIGSAMELDVDKAGRIGVSALLRDHAALTKDCVVMGMENYLEIWDEATYKYYLGQTQSSFGEAVQGLNLIPDWSQGS
jgi:MraZ protein